MGGFGNPLVSPESTNAIEYGASIIILEEGIKPFSADASYTQRKSWLAQPHKLVNSTRICVQLILLVNLTKKWNDENG